MVPAVPEWRYGRRGARMPWYPSVQLHRAAEIDVWDSVIARVAQELSLA
jgi:hypothetical protein